MSTPTLQDGQAGQAGQAGHDAVGGETLGERLRRAREAQGLKIEAVAEQLHMDVARLKALERDDFSSFPAAVFVRGYVRSYARLLALPEDELSALYEQQAVPSVPPLRPMVSVRYDKKTILMQKAGWALALLLFAAGGYWLAKFIPWGGYQDAALPTLPSPPPATKNTAVMAPPPVPEREAPLMDATSPAVAHSRPAVNTLVLRCNADCWVEIYDKQGKTLSYELAPRGATRRFEQPQLPFKVRLGNASAVSIEYNGKVFDHSRYTTRHGTADFVFGKKAAAALQAAEGDTAPTAEE